VPWHRERDARELLESDAMDDDPPHGHSPPLEAP
jgi:hypothetical protein